MTDEQGERLILTDQDGNYYLLTRAMLEQARVPAPYNAEIRAALEQQMGGEDVGGHAQGVTTLMATIGDGPGEEAGSSLPLPPLTSNALGEEGGTRLGQIWLPFEPPWFRAVRN